MKLIYKLKSNYFSFLLDWIFFFLIDKKNYLHSTNLAYYYSNKQKNVPNFSFGEQKLNKNLLNMVLFYFCIQVQMDLFNPFIIFCIYS